MYGKERLLVVVLVLLCVATIVSALATSLSVMLVGRVVQGAAGGIFPLAFGIIRDEFPRERVAGAVGIMSALLGVGGGAGVVLAGPIVEHLSIHWLFWLPLGSAGRRRRSPSICSCPSRPCACPAASTGPAPR